MADAHAEERRALRAEVARGRRLRPGRSDDLGLKRALSDRVLPAMVAAMAFLAALALAGFVAANDLGARWREGAGASLTVQVPQPGASSGSEDAPGGANRRDAVLAVLRATPGLASIHALTDSELADLLRPWLGSSGEAMTLPLPALIQVRRPVGGVELGALRARLDGVAPGTLVEDQDRWIGRLAALAHSLQLCTGLALLVVVAVAAAVVAAATRAGLVQRRQAIEIVHGLGATDGYIAGRFASRATALAAAGGALGAALALPVLLELAVLAAPFGGAPGNLAAPPAVVAWTEALPSALWAGLCLLPVGTCLIGWVTAQATVRRWLRRLA